MVVMKTPDAPATEKQLRYLHSLTGEDTSAWNLTMQQASDRIQAIERQSVIAQPVLEDDDPFSEAHVQIVEGDQRSGKTNYAVGKIVDAYDRDCVRIFCKNMLCMDVVAKSYDRASRIAKIKIGKNISLIRIPSDYTMQTPMKIFANIHLFGVRYCFIPSFAYLLAGLKSGFISDGHLLVDEAHKGMGARGSMTTLGKGFMEEYFQFGKSKLDVFIVTHIARLVDWTARTIPTTRIHTTYNEQTKEITYTLRTKGDQTTKEITYDSRRYWPFYRTNEKVLR